jgi:hypothetical protein
MSKFIPDPQIQSLRPMRAGDIAFANGGTMTIGKASSAVRSPEGLKSVSLAAVPGTEAVVGPFNESPLVGVADMTDLSQDALQSKSLSTTNALEAVSGPFNESPTVGVGKATSVV